MPIDLINNILVALQGLAIAFSLSFGGRAERAGGLILAGCILATWTAQYIGGHVVPAFMAIDLFTAFAFAVLALKHPEKLWPGIAGTAQFLVFVFSATRVIDYPLTTDAYIVAINLSALGIVLALAIGAARARWRPARLSEWDEFAVTLGQAAH